MSLKRFRKLARLMHFEHDVAAPDKGTVDVELGDRGPVREFLDRLADCRICQHIDGVDRRNVQAMRSALTGSRRVSPEILLESLPKHGPRAWT